MSKILKMVKENEDEILALKAKLSARDKQLSVAMEALTDLNGCGRKNCHCLDVIPKALTRIAELGEK